MKLEIPDELYERLRSRMQNKKDVIGKKYIIDVEHYCIKIITKYINKAEHLDNYNSSKKINDGIDWVKFKRKYFNDIIIRDQRKCRYCGKYLHLKDMTVDHIIPPIRGGENRLNNLALSCKFCNLDKGILLESEYRYKQLENLAKTKRK